MYCIGFGVAACSASWTDLQNYSSLRCYNSLQFKILDILCAFLSLLEGCPSRLTQGHEYFNSFRFKLYVRRVVLCDAALL